MPNGPWSGSKLGAFSIPISVSSLIIRTIGTTVAKRIAGGIVGALTQAGVSEDDAHSYAEGIRRGGTLVSARVSESDRSRLAPLLDESSVNMRDRTAAWQKAGWKSFDPTGQPYGADEVRRERQLYTGL